ncbi:MAG: 1-aminocyclopropane-1-carboxylate deaminase/D-cysteine desulfhydrase [Chitinophagaceae bacterium]
MTPLIPEWAAEKKIQVAILRLDLLDPEIMGNKWFKLKYNLQAAREENYPAILSFGGPYSNHIAATASACRLMGIPFIGVIRGEEPTLWSPTLIKAGKEGMQVQFISRIQYAQKDQPLFLDHLRKQWGDFYLIPEGGHNDLGVRGCEEILQPDRWPHSHLEYTSIQREDLIGFSHICCAVGTGTTLAGIINSADSGQQILGFGAMKNLGNVPQQIQRFLAPKRLPNYSLLAETTWGGFARIRPELTNYMKSFFSISGIPLDLIYTAKMMFKLQEMVGKDYFPPGSRILVIHTGGLQGNLSQDLKN